MRSNPLVRQFSLGWLVVLLLVGGVPSTHAASGNEPNPPVVSLGNDTYELTRRPTFFYKRSMEKLVKRARADAEKYCHDMGREMKELSVDEKTGGLVFGDFSQATVKFKALAPGDPGLAGNAAASAVAAPAGGSDLTKLEELHRVGVLADPEFDAAKKRLAERSLEQLHDKGVLSDSEYAAARKRLSER